MRLELTARDGRYFWSDWFRGHAYGILALTFVLLSVADLVASIRVLPLGSAPLDVREGNRLAHAIWVTHGAAGFITYKLALVLVVLVAVWLIDRRSPATSRGVLWGANVLMALVALRHLAIIAVMAV